MTRWLRSNVLGLAAIFVALGGVAWAATAPTNSVVSRSIKNGQVKAVDVAPNSLGAGQVNEGSLDTGVLQARVTADCGSNAALDSVNENGGGICNLFPTELPPSGAAGGDLTGTYPDPQLAPGTVTPAETGVVPAVRVRRPREPVDCLSGPTIPGDGTLTALRFVLEVFETVPTMHEQSCPTEPSRLTAPIPGIYEVSASVVWTNNATGTRFLGIRKNNDNDQFQAASRIPASADTPEQSVTTLVELAQGGYVEAVVSQNSGGPVTLDGNFVRQAFSMHWIGPGS